MREPFFDPEEEPEAVCANCSSMQGDLDGGKICINTRSPHPCCPVQPDMSCNKFWPDPKRWPDPDHD